MTRERIALHGLELLCLALLSLQCVDGTGVEDTDDDSLIEIPLYGGFATTGGVFGMDIEVGTPSQQFRVIFDTTSGSLNIPTVNCTACSPGSKFNYSASSTNSVSNYTEDCDYPVEHYYCGYEQSFFIQSIRNVVTLNGVLMTDGVSVLPTDNVMMPFGGFNNVTPSLNVGFEGILGFGFEELAQPGTRSWFSVASSEGQFPPVFSICLGDYGGSMILGGAESNLYHTESLKYVPNSKDNFYAVDLQTISVGDTVVKGLDVEDLNPAVLDSTVVDILLSRDALGQLLQTVQSDPRYCGNTHVPGLCYASQNLFLGNCYAITDFSPYPTFLFSLQNEVILEVDPSVYLYARKGLYCSHLKGSDRRDGTIFGSRLMYKYYTIFDRAKEQIGFALSGNCTGASYVMQKTDGDVQRGPLGQKLHNPLIVKVVNLTTNEPVSGVGMKDLTIDCRAPTGRFIIGNGAVSVNVSTTDESGAAQCEVYVGTIPGQNIVTAYADEALNSPLLFHITAHESYYLPLYAFLLILFAFGVLIMAVILSKKYKKESMYKLKRNIDEEMKQEVMERATLENSQLPEANLEGRDRIYWNTEEITSYVHHGSDSAQYSAQYSNALADSMAQFKEDDYDSISGSPHTPHRDPD